MSAVMPHFRMVVNFLKWALQPQGAPHRLQVVLTGASELEVQLNLCMVYELFVQIIASGLGVLAVVWATTVLLGGFSTSLKGADFWVIAAIVFIQTARVVGINVSPEAEFFNQVPPVLLKSGFEWYTTWGHTGQATDRKFHRLVKLGLASARKFIAIMAFLAILVLVIPMIAGLSCISLSIYRLVALVAAHHHNSNVFRALMLFYGLVLLQGGLFLISLYLKSRRSYFATLLRSKYGLVDKSEFIDKYMDKTMITAIKIGVSSTINGNLVSFAADLVKSDYNQDRIEAVLVIHRLTSQEDQRTRTLSQIQSSPLFVSRLLDMLTSKSRTDDRTKLCVAEIVSHLASVLRLADISGATESISSIIDPYFTKISTPSTIVNIDHQPSFEITIEQETTVQSSSTTCAAESKPLIIHGLLILAKLAVNPDNCKQIYDSKGLYSNIISLVKNKVYETGIAMEIAEKTLEVVSTLVSGTDETNGKILQDICISGIAVNHIHPIMERDRMYNKLKVPTTKILTKLYLSTRATNPTIESGAIAEFIKALVNIFFDVVNESVLRKTAGKALAILAMDNASCTMIMSFNTGKETSVVELLTTMFPEAINRLYQTAIAQLLTQFFANSDSNAERKGLESVKTILDEVLKVIYNDEQAATTNQGASPQHNLDQKQTANANQAYSPQHNLDKLRFSREHHCLNTLLRRPHNDFANRNAPGDSLPGVPQLMSGRRRKSLAAFLSLALQICDKLEINADDFDNALARISVSMGEFIDKLNYIIEQCKGHSVDSLEGKGPPVEYLTIIKTVTKLCTWMMNNKRDCIPVFQAKETSLRLQDALEDMRGLELGMLLTGNAGDMANYQNLSTVVAAARQKMDMTIFIPS